MVVAFRGSPLMRILHLDAGREMRGGQFQVLRLIEGLASAGIESTLLARADGALFGAVRKRGFRVEPLSLPRALANLRNHDLVHAHDARSHSLGLFLRSKPLVVSRRVSFPVGSRWKYGRASRYLAVSEFVKGVLMRGGVVEEKIAIVYDGVPLLEPSHGRNVLLLTKAPTSLRRSLASPASPSSSRRASKTTCATPPCWSTSPKAKDSARARC